MDPQAEMPQVALRAGGGAGELQLRCEARVDVKCALKEGDSFIVDLSAGEERDDGG